MGKNIQVMELNGITSEPAHIYHPRRGAIKGWRDLWHHWNVVFAIGALNRTEGLKPIGTLKLLKKISTPEEF